MALTQIDGRYMGVMLDPAVWTPITEAELAKRPEAKAAIEEMQARYKQAIAAQEAALKQFQEWYSKQMSGKYGWVLPAAGIGLILFFLGRRRGRRSRTQQG